MHLTQELDRARVSQMRLSPSSYSDTLEGTSVPAVLTGSGVTTTTDWLGGSLSLASPP